MVPRLKRAARRLYYRSRFIRALVAGAKGLGRREESPDLLHLARFDERVDGPLQRDEALLLHGLIRVIRPRTVVEFGFLRGHSAFNFLRALDQESRLYSSDIEPEAKARADEILGHDSRFRFRLRSQTEITADDVDGRMIDFVFLNASHDFALNQVTFGRLLPILWPSAILAVHDTGTAARALSQWALALGH
jgi:predicted O-methyltransferase YrrM